MALLTKRLSEPVGRDDQIRRLEELFDQVLAGEGTRVAFSIGDGGIGKSFLLEHLRSRWAEKGDALVPRRIIDLYDVVNHTVEGFLESLMRSYPEDNPFWSPVLAAYEEARRGLERARLRQEARAIREARQVLLDTVFRELGNLGRRFPLVIFLDTAERWAYRIGSDRLYWAQAWHVLRSWLHRWLQPFEGPAVGLFCVIAGRPRRVRLLRDQLLEHLDESARNATATVEIPAFSEAEVREFLQAYGLHDWMDQAAQIREWTQGHPLLLGLFVEVATRDARKTEDALARGKPEELVNMLMNTPEWMSVLPQMAVAARGMTPRHLAFMDEGEEPSESELAKYRHMLAAVRDSIFVKRRDLSGPWGEEEHLFLHDEMYRWVRRAVLPNLPESEKRIRIWLDRLRELNARGIKHLSRELGEVYLRLAEASSEFQREGALLQKVQEMEALRHQQETDRLYYGLRQSVYRGIRHYQRALWSMRALKRDDFMRMLQTEVWEYLDEVHQAREEGFSWFSLPKNDEDFLLYLRVLAAFYPVWELWAEERLADDLMSERLQEMKALVDRELPQGPARTLAHAWLSTANLVRLARQGKYREALREAEMWLKRVDQVDKSLETGPQERQEAWRWQCWWNMALLYYTLGFLHSQRQDTDAAARAFTQAQHWCVRLPFHFQEATAANDGGFALVHEDIERADHKVRRAFTIRKEWGWGIHMALSLNTLARLRIAEGHYEQARELSLKAQNIFRLLGYSRGLGLSALALAETLRRIGDESPMLSIEQRRKYYEEAERQAREALHLEKSLGKENLWRAYDELGRTYRQLAKLFHEQESAAPASDDSGSDLGRQAKIFARQARQALMAAQRVAREITDRTVGEGLALRSQVNLLWLEFYMGEPLERLEEGIEQVLRAIADLCPELASLPEARNSWLEGNSTGPCRHLAVEKGKSMVLLGRTYLRESFQGKQKRWVSEAGQVLVEAFEFSRLLGKAYPLLRIAGGQLVDIWAESLRQQQATAEDLRTFVEAAKRRAEALGLSWKETYLYHVLQTGELLFFD